MLIALEKLKDEEANDVISNLKRAKRIIQNIDWKFNIFLEVPSTSSKNY